MPVSVSLLSPVASAPDGTVHNSYVLMLLHYCYLYGCQVVLFAVLSAMAAFRRELSSNRVYVERDEGEAAVARRSEGGGGSNDRPPRVRTAWRLDILEQDVADIDEILEGAGNIYGPVFTVILALWARVALAKYKHFPSALEEAGGGSSSRSSRIEGVGASRRSRGDARSSSAESGAVRAGGNGGSRDVTRLGSDGVSSAKKSPNLWHPTVTVLSLPPDAQIHVLSFLHPRDVVRFACTSRGSHCIVDDETSEEDGNSTSLLLWKELWKRDYAWVVCGWDVGKQALARSMGLIEESPRGTEESRSREMISVFKHLESSIAEDVHENDSKSNIVFNDADDIKVRHMSMKDFYFTFGQVWINYTLAGQNNSSRCLVGLHGHAFDITDFFEQHPGSPETLIVQSGRDATLFFEDLGHSVGARKIAMTMCVVLDRASAAGGSGKCGLLKPGSTIDKSERKLPKASWARSVTAKNAIPKTRSKPRRPGTLYKVRAKLDKEEHQAQIGAEKWLSRTLTHEGILGNIHVYYDVFVGKWMFWYTNSDFKPVFLDQLENP